MTCCTRSVSVVGLLLACVAVPAWAQTNPAAGRGRLIVTVVDTTGAVLPGATVTVNGNEDATRAATLAPAKATEAGVVNVPSLVPGRYTVKAEFPAFEAGVLQDVRIRAGTETRQTITLKLARVEDNVTVGMDTREAASDRGATFGTALTRDQIEALSEDPELMRQQLEDMAGPGTVISVDSFEGGQLPHKSQIRSIRIARDQFAAESHSAGIGRIEIVTQPGVGPLRGSVGTTYYDSALDGRNPLVGRRGPAQNRSLSGSIGGGLLKNRLSFGVSMYGTDTFSTPVQAAGNSPATNLAIKQGSSSVQFSGQMDYALTRDQTLRMAINRYSFNSDNQGVGGNNLIERAYSTRNANTNVYLQQTGPIGRRFVLNTRMQLSINHSRAESALEAPTYVISDSLTSGGAQQRGGTRNRSGQFSSDLDYVRGIHSVRTGVLIEGGQYRSDNSSNYLGTYTFESHDAFEAGRPRSYTRRIGDPYISYSNYQVGVYVQDDIRVSRALSLSPGLRYEWQSYAKDKLNLAPRFGFTWAPFAGGRTTFRSSIGIFYDWIGTFLYQQTLQIDGFRQQEVNILNPSFPDPGDLVGAPPTNKYLFGDTVSMPRTVRVSAGVSHTFSPRLTIGSVYAYSQGTGLLVGENLNAPVDGRRPDPNFANVVRAVPGGESRLHQLTTNINLNLAAMTGPAMGGPFLQWRRGLRLSGQYMTGSSRNNTDGAFSTPATGDLSQEWGPANFDVRHRGSVSFGSGAIRNLNASVNVNMSSAPPLTIRTGFDDNGDLIFNDRPAGVGRNSARTTGQWNSSAQFSYSIPLGSRQITSGGGVSITSSGGAAVVNMIGAQSIPRYRLNLMLQIQNLTNHANYTGYSGAMTSPRFLQPTSASGVRRVTFGMNVSF